jgi:hypothetical protein
VNTRPAIVSVPVRAAPVFTPTKNVTVPFPLSVPLDVTAIHGALLTAVHVQLFGADTSIAVPTPPAAPMLWFVGEIEALHAGAIAPCVTVARCPAIVMLPVRASPVLGGTVKATVPLPVPLSGGVSVIQLESVEAVHAQSSAVAMLTLPAPPLALTFWFAGVSA